MESRVVSYELERAKGIEKPYVTFIFKYLNLNYAIIVFFGINIDKGLKHVAIQRYYLMSTLYNCGFICLIYLSNLEHSLKR